MTTFALPYGVTLLKATKNALLKQKKREPKTIKT